MIIQADECHAYGGLYSFYIDSSANTIKFDLTSPQCKSGELESFEDDVCFMLASVVLARVTRLVQGTRTPTYLNPTAAPSAVGHTTMYTSTFFSGSGDCSSEHSSQFISPSGECMDYSEDLSARFVCDTGAGVVKVESFKKAGCTESYGAPLAVSTGCVDTTFNGEPPSTSTEVQCLTALWYKLEFNPSREECTESFSPLASLYIQADVCHVLYAGESIYIDSVSGTVKHDATGTTCSDKFEAIPFTKGLCFNDPNHNFQASLSVYIAPPTASCKPKSSQINRKRCAGRTRRCQDTNPLRWAGRGCEVKAGDKSESRNFDGGCQCYGYCGFGCKKA
jgi:hypothetical protein